MLDSEQLHNELIKLGYKLETGKNEPSYAYEHYLGNDKYLYIKRKKDHIVTTAPLVLHPDCLSIQYEINQIDGIQVTWDITKSTSYRRYPKYNGASQYGYDASVESPEALAQLLTTLTDTHISTDCPTTPSIQTKVGSTMFPLNQILFGPPGSGKTYATTELAVRIADTEWYESIKNGLDASELRKAVKERYEQLIAKQRVMFTTFHQSFSYEDFIEGIRAQTDELNGGIRYEIAEGIFKQLCANAQMKVHGATSDSISLKGKGIWKMSLGNTLDDENNIFDECIENNYILLGYGKNVDYSKCNDRLAVQDCLSKALQTPVDENDYAVTSVNYFKNHMKIGDIVVVSDGNLKFRAIAEITGEYQYLNTPERTGYQQFRKVKWLRIYEPSLPIERLFLKSLSQMTLYSLKPTTIDHTKLIQLLSSETKTNEASLPHVLIIDEINRGNISRIFGELITLLEPSKRSGASDAQSVILPYSKKPFSVPNNVFVIGTMNTADRSLAQLDLALRRRFSFIETPPQPELLRDVTVHDISMADMLNKMNQRIEILLDNEHAIGHAYFMPLTQVNDIQEKERTLRLIFKDKILPLLQEYFFDDYERIGWVLNDPAKDTQNRFIQTDSSLDLPKLRDLFPSAISEQLIDKRFRINISAFTNADSYRGIIG